MSHAHSESDSFDTAVVVPDVGDTTYPSTVPQGMGALTNRTRWHENTLNGGVVEASEVVLETNGSVFPVNNESATIMLPATGRADVFRIGLTNAISKIRGLRSTIKTHVWGAGSSNQFFPVVTPPSWERSGGGGYQTPGSTPVGDQFWNAQLYGLGSVAYYQKVISGGAPSLVFQIAGLPPTGTIIFMGVMIKGATAHSGLPETMPTLNLYSTVIGSGGSTWLATVTDTSVNTTAYQTEHLLSLDGLSVPIGSNTIYSLEVVGEAGTNALINMYFSGLYIAIAHG